jgi:EAL domain-containing protein (putative c-di-GMP-specific phosphodiesterase class I)
VILGRTALPIAQMGPDALLFVNLHSSDLVMDWLYGAGNPLLANASRVVFEVTERAALDTVPDVKERVRKLREMGFRIALDDIGAGYSGLTSFALLEPEVVKIDMALVRDVDREPTKQKLVRSMAGLCRDMGLTVVAEGVETVAERDTLAGLGIDVFQGYLFARPGAPFPAVSWNAG